MTDFPERLTALQPFWGSWVLDSFIGEGSYGKVFRIRREEMEKTTYAALKWITLPKNRSELDEYRTEGLMENDVQRLYRESVHRFREEIDLMSQLRGNSHIVNYEDHLILERKNEIGWDILIRMELLTPLNQRFREGMTVGDVVKLGLDICDALERCAKAYVIHRDIKPDNIFISQFGDYKLGDFGVARSLDETATHLSKQGTPVFMAPEVYLGKGKYDATVDLYSLGLVMHRLLNRQRLPFLPMNDEVPTHAERNTALETRLRGTPIPQPVDGGAELAKVICRACAFDSKKRYHTAEEMHNALQKAAEKINLKKQLTVNPTGAGLDSGRSSLPPGGTGNRSGRNTDVIKNSQNQRRRFMIWLWIVIAVAAAFVLGGFGMKLWMEKQTKQPAPTISVTAEPTATSTSVATATPVPTATPTPTPTPNPIVYPNSSVENAVRKAVGISNGNIYPKDVCEITCLELNEMGILDLSFLKYFSGLEELYLQNNDIIDISTLASLKKLTSLHLGYNKISDVSPLKDLVNLNNLYLEDNKITDISSLQGLTKLYGLCLDDNKISDIKPLQYMTNMIGIGIGGNLISDISPLENMTDITYLYLGNNHISDISCIQNMESIKVLHLYNNKISDISALQSLTQLNDLELYYNYISDISPLRNLYRLTVLSLDHNSVKDIEALKYLAELKVLGLRCNKISDLESLKNLTNLEELYLSENQFTSIASLSNLTELKILYLDSDSKVTLFSTLSNFKDLTELNLGYTQISSISILQMLTNLKKIILDHTSLTSAQIALLKQSLPDAEIKY